MGVDKLSTSIFSLSALIIAGATWLVLTVSLRNKIKKYWLYALFPTSIFSFALLGLYFKNETVHLKIIIPLFLLLIFSYYFYRIVRGFGFRDTILIPEAIIILLTILLVLG